MLLLLTVLLPLCPQMEEQFRNFVMQVTHMPPELLSDGMLTKAADVYAFGA